MNKTKENTAIKAIKIVSKETLNDIKKAKIKENINKRFKNTRSKTQRNFK